MPLAPDYYTAEMVRAMPPDGKRHEVVHGELCVSAMPRMWHQVVVMRLGRMVGDYCARHSVGRAFDVGGDIAWASDSLVVPDVFVIAPDDDATEWEDVRHLSLVAEVLSPSTATFDRFQKRRLYQEQGIQTLWIIDADRRSVEVWTPTATFPVIATERLLWHPASAPEPLVIELGTLFA